MVVEGLLAIPLIMLCILITGLTQLVITAFVPEPVVTPDVAKIIQRSEGTMTMYLLLFAIALYGPIAEELFFRGFLFNAFRDRMPLIAAVLIQSILFAVLHCYSAEYTIIVFPTALVLTLVYYWRATILTPMFIHIGFNSLAAIRLLFIMHAAANQPVLGVSPQLEATECIVAIVHPGSPADAAGILAGDTITHVDQYTIENFQDLLSAIADSQPGEKVVVVLMRDGEQVVVEATLVSRKTLRSNMNQAPQP
ncbi:MAG: hypothetical protein COA78_27320 [Blastopirellula sp.]|nr:MAG: hypothetical protein COA78_27320 [Blastopirellula sp.]